MTQGSAPACVTCRKPVPETAAHRPFCCARCKMVDLGRWFHEEYFVPGEPAVDIEGLEALVTPLESSLEEGGLDERDA